MKKIGGRCPKCGHKLDTTTEVEQALSEGKLSDTGHPKAGDFTLCVGCGLALRFVDAGKKLGVTLLKADDTKEMFENADAAMLMLSSFITASSRRVEDQLKPFGPPGA